MPYSGDIRLVGGCRYVYSSQIDEWMQEEPRPTRSRQPSYIYRTVVDNKIRYKGKVYTHRDLTKGRLDGERLHFKHYPPPAGNNDEIMMLLSTAVVHEGEMRGLSNSMMEKFHVENRRLLFDRYGNKVYEHWFLEEIEKKKKKAKTEIVVDEPVTYTVPLSRISTIAPNWVYEYVTAAGRTTAEPPRRLTPAEDARVNDEEAHRFQNIEVGHMRDDTYTILQDHTALFDDVRGMLQRRYGIVTDNIVGSTRHYWLMDDGSIVDRSNGQITLNININDETVAIHNTESHSTILLDGTELPNVDRVAMEQAGLSTDNIIGSTESYWITRHNNAILKGSSEMHPMTEALREHWLNIRGNSPTLRRWLTEEDIEV